MKDQLTFVLAALGGLAAIALTGCAADEVPSSPTGASSPVTSLHVREKALHPPNATQHPTARHDIPRFPAEHDGPCAGGTALALPVTALDVPLGAPRWRPATSATLGRMTGFWDCAGQGYIYRYASGIDVDLMRGWSGTDNETKWPAYIRDNGYGEIRDVRGEPGLVEEPEGSYDGQVMVIDSGYLIRVSGNGSIPARVLVEVADGIAGPGPRVETNDGPAGLVGPGQPCPGAVHLPTNLPAIEQQVDVPIWKPTSATISRAWRCGETPVLMLDGIQVSFESGWSGIDIDERWSALAEDYGGEIHELAGRSALVQGAVDPGDSNQVLIVQGDTLIRFLAPADVPLTRLTALADSLPLT